MPNLIKTANPAPCQSLYIRQGDVLVIAYKGQGRRQPVRMLSTGITARDENGIPALITGYNRNMGGVDESDMLMSIYNAGRKLLETENCAIVAFVRRADGRGGEGQDMSAVYADVAATKHAGLIMPVMKNRIGILFDTSKIKEIKEPGND